MIDLVEFLLARFAEQEAWIRGDGRHLDECQECAFGQQPQSPYSIDLLLADLEAKRRIIQQVVPAIDDLTSSWASASDALLFVEDYPSYDLLRLLALPYADRPGYRDEWRP